MSNAKKKSVATVLSVLGIFCLALIGGVTADVFADPEPADATKIATVIKDFENINSNRLNALRPLAVRQYEIPKDSVDVMRARITETYVVDGVGEDTVELTGWVAVKHFDARPIAGAEELTWNTLVVDTQFVAMELSGKSDVFGPVQVKLNKDRPVTGQVGQIEIPEYAEIALLAELDKGDTQENTSGATAGEGDASDTGSAPGETGYWWLPGSCVAPVVASISMPDLDLEMETVSPVYWYSLVDTIPPVGHTASIAIEPVRLSANGREVGTLKGGKVHFREVVRQVYLSDKASDQFADSK